jgi:hypothetical protein
MNGFPRSRLSGRGLLKPKMAALKESLMHRDLKLLALIILSS